MRSPLRRIKPSECGTQRRPEFGIHAGCRIQMHVRCKVIRDAFVGGNNKIKVGGDALSGDEVGGIPAPTMPQPTNGTPAEIGAVDAPQSRQLLEKATEGRVIGQHCEGAMRAARRSPQQQCERTYRSRRSRYRHHREDRIEWERRRPRLRQRFQGGPTPRRCLSRRMPNPSGAAEHAPPAWVFHR